MTLALFINVLIIIIIIIIKVSFVVTDVEGGVGRSLASVNMQLVRLLVPVYFAVTLTTISDQIDVNRTKSGHPL